LLIVFICVLSFVQPEEEKAERGRRLRGDLRNISRVGVRRMRPNSFQWCPATGQGATGTN